MAVNLLPTSLDPLPDTSQNNLLLSYLKTQKQKQETLAQRLQEQASSTTPVYNTAQGLARVLTGGLAAYNDYLDKNDAKAAGEARLKASAGNFKPIGDSPIPDLTGAAGGGSSDDTEKPDTTTPSVPVAPSAIKAAPVYASILRDKYKDDPELNDPKIISAIGGNFGTESGGRQDALGDYDKKQGAYTALGPGQWRNERLANLYDVADQKGVDPSNPDAWAAHTANELKGPYRHVLDAMKAAPDEAAAARVFAQRYEIPSDAALQQSLPSRIAGARSAYQALQGSGAALQNGPQLAYNGEGSSMNDSGIAIPGMAPSSSFQSYGGMPNPADKPVPVVGSVPQDWRTATAPEPPTSEADIQRMERETGMVKPDGSASITSAPSRTRSGPAPQARQAAASVSSAPPQPNPAPQLVPMASQTQQSRWANNSLSDDNASRDGGAGAFARGGMGSPMPQGAPPAPAPQPQAPMPQRSPQMASAPPQAGPGPAPAPAQAGPPNLGQIAQNAYRAGTGQPPQQGDVQLPPGVQAEYTKDKGGVTVKNVSEIGNKEEINALKRQAQMDYVSGGSQWPQLLQQANSKAQSTGRSVTYSNGRVMFFPWEGQPKEIIKPDKDKETALARIPTDEERQQYPNGKQISVIDSKGIPHYQDQPKFENTNDAKRAAIGWASVEKAEQQGITARSELHNLSIVQDALNAASKNGGTLPQGYLGEHIQTIKSAAKSLGFDVENVGPGEVVQKINAQLASNFVNQISSRPAVFEYATGLRSTPGLLQSEEGRQALIYLRQQEARRNMLISKKILEQKGSPDFSPKSLIDIEEQVDNEMPMFSPFRKDANGNPERIVVPKNWTNTTAPELPEALKTYGLPKDDTTQYFTLPGENGRFYRDPATGKVMMK